MDGMQQGAQLSFQYEPIEALWCIALRGVNIVLMDNIPQPRPTTLSINAALFSS